MPEKKSNINSETFSLATTITSSKASIKSKFNFLKRKSEVITVQVKKGGNTKKENCANMNYQAMATYMSLK